MIFHQLKTEPLEPVNELEILQFLEDLSNKQEPWQVEQAGVALRLLMFYQAQQLRHTTLASKDNSEKWQQEHGEPN